MPGRGPGSPKSANDSTSASLPTATGGASGHPMTVAEFIGNETTSRTRATIAASSSSSASVAAPVNGNAMSGPWSRISVAAPGFLERAAEMRKTFEERKQNVTRSLNEAVASITNDQSAEHTLAQDNTSITGLWNRWTRTSDQSSASRAVPPPAVPNGENESDNGTNIASSRDAQHPLDVWRSRLVEAFAPYQCGPRPDQSPITSELTTFFESFSEGGSRRLEFHKSCVKAAGKLVTDRSRLAYAFPATVHFYDRLRYPGVQGLIALTIDDAPCTPGLSTEKVMIEEVRELLAEFGAQATFFLMTDSVPGNEHELHRLIQDGHEVANHCPLDRIYADDTEADFESAILSAERVCESLRAHASVVKHPSSQTELAATSNNAASEPRKPRWFRAPQAKLGNAMKHVMNRHGFTHVLTDCYANDPWISDPEFIAEFMLSMACDGSIALIHMPEAGFREYNLNALRFFLQGLRARGMQAVTLSSLHNKACSSFGRERLTELALRKANAIPAMLGEVCLPQDISSYLAMSSESRERSESDPLADLKQGFHKACMRGLANVRHRASLDTIFPASLCYINPCDCPGVRGAMALTIDDALCRQTGADRCMAKEVESLLREFHAKATFFLTTDFVFDHKDAAIMLLESGHEFANHCREDRSYADDSEADFETALLCAEHICDELRKAGGVRQLVSRPRWFRAPLAKLSGSIRNVLNRHGFTHVLCDCYANDPWISDPGFIAETMLSHAESGSVAVLHMPERGFREYNLQALRMFLSGVRDKGLEVLSLGELYQRAYGDAWKPESALRSTVELVEPNAAAHFDNAQAEGYEVSPPSVAAETPLVETKAEALKIAGEAAEVIETPGATEADVVVE